MDDVDDILNQSQVADDNDDNDDEIGSQNNEQDEEEEEEDDVDENDMMEGDFNINVESQQEDEDNEEDEDMGMDEDMDADANDEDADEDEDDENDEDDEDDEEEGDDNESNANDSSSISSDDNTENDPEEVQDQQDKNIKNNDGESKEDKTSIEMDEPSETQSNIDTSAENKEGKPTGNKESSSRSISDGLIEDNTNSSSTSMEPENKLTSPNDNMTMNDKIYNYYTQMRQSSKIVDSYVIYPTAATPIQTDVNALTVSKGLKYLFLGGNDGYIRKYDLLNTLEGKLSLTILQKHALTESIQNAGILQNYWENEIPQKKSEVKLAANKKEYEMKVSPVYSLAVESECMFLLSGLSNGGITMHGVRYMEGSIGHYFAPGKQGHSNVVNILKMNGEENRFISGSWDKKILEWDLQNGKIVNEFKGTTSELSSLELRPLFSTVDINNDIISADSNTKMSTTNSENNDDEMESLFGDDEEDEDADINMDKDDDDEKNANKKMGNDTKIPSIADEISKTKLNIVYDESVFMTSGLNGSIHIWDRRNGETPVLNLQRGPDIPPWCLSACWNVDGDHIYAGRRNACVEEFDIKMPSKPCNVLKLPTISGPVSNVYAMPNNKQLLVASRDNIRLYNTKPENTSKSSGAPFLIVPGHHGGSISNLYVDPTCRFLISTSGNRGWQGVSTDLTLIYDIDLA
ncbi:SAGA complex subunit SPT8 NDAI_0C06420 [Naumovozyma dairenensis CBS 421]|uniref:Transcription factor spt8 beta-propeller domain-containing protein n=1 Tax=Naumovozyma dairenensis (strain ATCC 10597 / BCRC 20456 / CBS 421 / NBRC 0211 / NRRL Y-12639) TaxID=1071378 RepID=G0W940_NAUDC|nr:hypothetical protein NDAI_0C06420 [Naumovozyma dairenensis CBS 421]CCD24301.1 hypothetical protein NDAI_0C06420 [Naumovozyma dairenensis CBS 421]